MNGTYLVGTTCRRGRHLGCILFSATCSACTFRPHAGLQGMTRCYMQLLDFTGSDILHFLLRALYSYGFIFLATSISPFPLLLTSRGLFGQVVLFLKKTDNYCSFRTFWILSFWFSCHFSEQCLHSIKTFSASRFTLPVRQLWVGKELEEERAGTAVPNRPKRYPISCDVMLSI